MLYSQKRKKKQVSLREEVLKTLHAATKPLNYKQVSFRLGIEDKPQKMLIRFLLRELAKKKVIKESAHGEYYLDNEKNSAYSIGKKAQNLSSKKTLYLTGTVDMMASGAAYIIVEGEKQDIYVAPQNTNGAIEGDKVRVRIIRKRGKKPEGVIEEILERTKTKFVGTLRVSRGGAFLIPDNFKIPFHIYIPQGSTNNATNGQKVVARITDWLRGRKNPQGEVVKILGEAGNNDTEIHAILEEFQLPYTFPKEVIEFAEKIPDGVTKEEISRRRDFRNVTTFTIDPFDAKDFDDAISVRAKENGLWEIGIHIADVTHYVKEGTVLDKEAYLRGTSVYLVDRVVPMLPEKLSNVLCSLRPKEEKLCFSAVFEMDDQARIHSRWFGRTVIESNYRFTYEEAQQIIETGKGPFAQELLLLDRLAKKLRAERLKKGSIAFEKLEVKFYLDEAGNPTGVFSKQIKDSNKLIEDFMLLANKEVAKFCSPLSSSKHTKEKNEEKVNSPFVYRVHDKPDMEKLKSFAEIVSRMGYKLNLKNETTIAETMNHLLKEMAGKPEANMIEMLAIRTMAKAMYSTKNIGHFGLGFKHYTHFTSPIRRYPDIMVHRLLAQKLQTQNSPTEKADSTLQVRAKTMEEQCKHASEREILAADAERASIRYKQVQFLKDKVGEEFDGIISGITEWGIFVELTDTLCEGLVRMRDMPHQYIVDEHNYCLINRKTKEKLTLGDKVRVEVKKTDMVRRQVDFVLIE